MRRSRGDWESPATESLLEHFAEEQFGAGIVGLYVVKLSEKQARYKTILDRPADESDHGQNQNDIIAARLEQLLRARPAEVYLAPYHKTQDGYHMIVLGKVLPTTGLYIPESTVPLLLDQKPDSCQARLSEAQATILLNECVELADHHLVPGNEFDELE